MLDACCQESDILTRTEPDDGVKTVINLPRGKLLEEISAKYRQGTGRWIGCDWQTDFGSEHLNLAELKASQVLLLARATAGNEAANWQAASQWLTRIEQEAQEAESEAGIALALASNGQFREALLHAQRACAIEARYHSQLRWQPFCMALEQITAFLRENG
jgi:hypothetical protein